jgi:bifunctional DNA-binding transcriptional regulator/antitoxin component of YhaV-PrlF toxin-antitoxin module
MIITIEESGKITLPPEYIEELRLKNGVNVEISHSTMRLSRKDCV